MPRRRTGPRLAVGTDREPGRDVEAVDRFAAEMSLATA
jgi:hypothetical protein